MPQRPGRPKGVAPRPPNRVTIPPGHHPGESARLARCAVPATRVWQPWDKPPLTASLPGSRALPAVPSAGVSATLGPRPVPPVPSWGWPGEFRKLRITANRNSSGQSSVIRKALSLALGAFPGFSEATLSLLPTSRPTPPPAPRRLRPRPSARPAGDPGRPWRHAGQAPPARSARGSKSPARAGRCH